MYIGQDINDIENMLINEHISYEVHDGRIYYKR